VDLSQVMVFFIFICVSSFFYVKFITSVTLFILNSVFKVLQMMTNRRHSSIEWLNYYV